MDGIDDELVNYCVNASMWLRSIKTCFYDLFVELFNFLLANVRWMANVNGKCWNGSPRRYQCDSTVSQTIMLRYLEGKNVFQMIL
jgi:hypothetical protein